MATTAEEASRRPVTLRARGIAYRCCACSGRRTCGRWGVGIVLVGEFTGWNFSADKGGAPRRADRVLVRRPAVYVRRHDRLRGHLDSRRGQAVNTAQAKHIVGPLMAFNVALYLVFAYTMLEVSDAILAGDLITQVGTESGATGLNHNPFIVPVYRGARVAQLSRRGSRR